MKLLRNVLLLAAAAAGLARGQGYDCRILFSVTATGTNTPQFDNRSNGCNYWTVVYQAANVSVLQLTVQSAMGSVTPGAWGTFTGTVISGINPNTSTSGAQTILSGFNSWIRVNVTLTDTGGALVNGVLYGYRSGFNSSTNGCAGTAGVPCRVAGPTAAGSAAVTPPVLVGGQDGAPGLIRVLKTDASGQPIPANASAVIGADLSTTEQIAQGAGAVPLFQYTMPTVYNGANVLPQRGNNTGITPSNASQNAADAQGPSFQKMTDVNGTVFWFNMIPFGFNSASFDKVRTAALGNVTPATTLTARNSLGNQQVEFGSRWVVNSSPATGTVGSASIAAEASVRHVADNVCFSAQSSGGAVTAAALTVTIRDGATGAGTVLRTFQVALPAAANTGQQEVAPFCTPTGMGLVGTTATAMTAEFSAGATNLNESISITGYNVN